MGRDNSLLTVDFDPQNSGTMFGQAQIFFFFRPSYVFYGYTNTYKIDLEGFPPP